MSHKTTEQIKKIKSEMVFVGPSLAQAWLDTTDKNRTVRNNRVSMLASAIDRGEWDLNGSTIVFDDDGHLIDGRHRLHAIIKSGKSVWVMVVKGVSKDAFATIDNTLSRQAADVLMMSGHMRGPKLASAMRWHYAITEGKSYSDACKTITPSMCLEYVEKNDELPASTKFIDNLAFRWPVGLMSALHCIFSAEHGRIKSDPFFTGVASGILLERDSPQFKLREFFLDAALNKFVIKPESACTAAIKCWNAYIGGLKLLKLHASPKEDRPEIH